MNNSQLHDLGSKVGKVPHARLNRFVGLDPELLQESLRRFTHEQLPWLERVSGFRTIFFGVDLENGKAAGITFWESEAELHASESIEDGARRVSLARAGGSFERGLVDNYRIVLELQTEPAREGMFARLARWEGVRPERIRHALSEFEERELPVLEETPGFRGLFVGVDALLGNTLSVSLWSSKENLLASLEWEREVRATVESGTGLVARRVIADIYSVALLPRLGAQPLPWTSGQEARAVAGLGRPTRYAPSRLR